MATAAPPRAASKYYAASAYAASAATQQTLEARPRGARAVWDILSLFQVAQAQLAERAVDLMLIEQEIQVDADADFAVLDLDARGTLSDAHVYTKVGWSPYSGMAYHGLPVMTVVRGRVVMRDGRVTGEPGFGQLVTRPAAS